MVNVRVMDADDGGAVERELLGGQHVLALRHRQVAVLEGVRVAGTSAEDPSRVSRTVDSCRSLRKPVNVLWTRAPSSG